MSIQLENWFANRKLFCPSPNGTHVTAAVIGIMWTKWPLKCCTHKFVRSTQFECVSLLIES